MCTSSPQLYKYYWVFYTWASSGSSMWKSLYKITEVGSAGTEIWIQPMFQTIMLESKKWKFSLRGFGGRWSRVLHGPWFQVHSITGHSCTGGLCWHHARIKGHKGNCDLLYAGCVGSLESSSFGGIPDPAFNQCRKYLSWIHRIPQRSDSFSLALYNTMREKHTHIQTHTQYLHQVCTKPAGSCEAISCFSDLGRALAIQTSNPSASAIAKEC